MSMAPPSPTDARGGKTRRISDEGPSDRRSLAEQAHAVFAPEAEVQPADTTERLCITVDGAGRRRSEFIRLGIEMGGTGSAVRSQA